MITIGETLITEGLMKSDMIREKVISSLKKGKFSPIGAFGIFEPQNPSNLYEIISLNELRKLPYRKGHYKMIGLTGSRLEAIMLVAKLWMKKDKQKE
ncbi:MAG: hypothetical protein D8H95_34615 [Lachnospiraceae bacterium]|nr:MAG: hypothetical protein D8H95_34615 [Lachnospiraceae bacterium]